MYRIAIVGAYGNFGSIIQKKLSGQDGAPFILSVGRDEQKLIALTHGDKSAYWAGDAHSDAFADALRQHRINLVIHTAGPFQGQDYTIARSAIAAGANYCDLSDCRHFVRGISVLDDLAQQAGVFVLSGCSSVPTLSAAVIDHFQPYFRKIDEIDYGITSSSKMPGVSTIRGVLQYAGKHIEQFENGAVKRIHGWQDLTLHRFPGMGSRLLANVDVPDMDIFPVRYGAHTVKFQAGAGLKMGTFANFCAASLARLGLVASGSVCADWLHTVGKRFEWLGDKKSLMYIKIAGMGIDGLPYRHRWEIEAWDDKGPTIPASGSVALARMLVAGVAIEAGARACVGVIPMETYLDAIGEPAIVTRDRAGD